MQTWGRGGSWGALSGGHPGRVAGSKAVIWGGSGALCNSGALGSHLKLNWHGPGCSRVHCACHLGAKNGAVVGTEQGCLGVYHPVATLMGCLGLMWARSPGFTKVVGWLGHTNCALISTFQVEGEHRPCQAISPRESSSSFLPFDKSSRADPFIN